MGFAAKQAAESVVAGMQASETPEAWESMLLGLAELFKGLASEPGLPELGSDGQAHHLSRDALQTLLDASASADARSAVLAIAGAQSGSQASADIQSRCLAQLYTLEACCLRLTLFCSG